MKTIALLIMVIIMPSYAVAQNNSSRAQDEAAMRNVVSNLETAWKNADAILWADQFEDDVDFTVWNGIYFNGRADNIVGHQQIWGTIYKDTYIKSEIRKFRFLSDNLAAVFLKSQMFRDGKQLVEGSQTSVVPLLIMEKTNGKWLIAVFQNTPVINSDDAISAKAPDQ